VIATQHVLGALPNQRQRFIRDLHCLAEQHRPDPFRLFLLVLERRRLHRGRVSTTDREHVRERTRVNRIPIGRGRELQLFERPEITRQQQCNAPACGHPIVRAVRAVFEARHELLAGLDRTSRERREQRGLGLFCRGERQVRGGFDAVLTLDHCNGRRPL
jgi:hypothetical protein